MLRLSHYEVVHGKGSLLDKMLGDLWQNFADLWLPYAHSRKKLLRPCLLPGRSIGGQAVSGARRRDRRGTPRRRSTLGLGQSLKSHYD
jgi:hypothetical protein